MRPLTELRDYIPATISEQSNDLEALRFDEADLQPGHQCVTGQDDEGSHRDQACEYCKQK
jgi:hypothetical protein